MSGMPGAPIPSRGLRRMVTCRFDAGHLHQRFEPVLFYAISHRSNIDI
jgi:hypothetical protein